jgi:hypothetical protein
VEKWTVAPATLAEWTLTLGGANPLPLVAIHEVSLQAEP